MGSSKCGSKGVTSLSRVTHVGALVRAPGHPLVLPPSIALRVRRDRGVEIRRSRALGPGRMTVVNHVLCGLARGLPAEIRDALAADPDAKVVKAIAPHPGLSDARLRDIARRHGTRIAAGVAAAAHPALPEHVVVALLAGPDPQVAEAAATNPSLPSAVMWDPVPRP